MFFLYLQLLANITHSIEPSSLRNELDPDLVAGVIKNSKPKKEEICLLIRYVNHYSPALFIPVIVYARVILQRFPMPAGAEDKYTNSGSEWCTTVKHFLDVLDLHAGEAYSDDLLSSRASLLVLYASLLVHVHARNGKLLFSEEILDLNGQETAGSYTNEEGFQVVQNALVQLKETLGRLKERGLELDSRMLEYIRKDVGVQQPDSSVENQKLCDEVTHKLSDMGIEDGGA